MSEDIRKHGTVTIKGHDVLYKIIHVNGDPPGELLMSHGEENPYVSMKKVWPNIRRNGLEYYATLYLKKVLKVK